MVYLLGRQNERVRFGTTRGPSDASWHLGLSGTLPKEVLSEHHDHEAGERYCQA